MPSAWPHTHMHRFVLVFVLLNLNLLGCKTVNPEGAAPKVIQGLETKNDEFDSVVKVLPSRGSGAFLNDRVVITAAHVVIEPQTWKVARSYVIDPSTNTPIYAEKVLVPNGGEELFRRYMEQQPVTSMPEFTGRDIAILVFPEGTAQKLAVAPEWYLRFATTPVQAGDRLYLVGFGYSDYNDKSTLGIRRWGRNQVVRVEDSYIEMHTNPSDTFNNSKLASGDSGGPVLNQMRQIVGINSTANSANHGGSYAVNLVGNGPKTVLQELLREGGLDAQALYSKRPPDKDGDGISDDKDLCSLTPRGQRVHINGEWIGCALGQKRDRG